MKRVEYFLNKRAYTLATGHRLLLTACCALFLGGCAVPAHMRVENVSHPKYEDKDVRFRTTYYFRVYDYCADSTKSKAPLNDTLYRFRMSGKAQSLTTKVRFESGTLTAGQIDPFGASVVYNEQSRQSYFKSQTESQQEGRQEKKFDDLRRLLKTYTEMTAGAVGSKSLDKDFESERKAMREVINERIQSLKDAKTPDPSETSEKKTNGTSVSDEKSSVPEVMSDLNCRKMQRGFQILGPEGWRNFNQDDRLLLAMSISGRPLISTMQEISGRVLNNQPIEAEMLLPLVREDLRLSNAGRQLDRFDGTNPDRGVTLLDAAIRELSATEIKK